MNLEGGLDTGNMCSLVIGQQENERIYRVLKELPQVFLQHLGEQFENVF